MHTKRTPMQSDQQVMAKSSGYLWAEMFGLFVCIPILLALPIPVVSKVFSAAAALGYCLLVSRSIKLFNWRLLVGENWQSFTQSMALRFISFVAISSLLVSQLMPDALFSVITANPLLWIGMSLFYSVFSVYPQEFVYRTFFFARYLQLIPNTLLFIVINALLFSLAHSFLLNGLVFALTLAGGLLFALTYHKSKSLVLVSLEHSLYGVWLFTVGLGEQLAFPSA